MANFNPFLYGNPASIGQQTAAGQAITLQRAGGSKGGKRSARKRKATRAAAAPRKRAKRAKPVRLVKGSAAAKAHMAKIRRKRK